MSYRLDPMTSTSSIRQNTLDFIASNSQAKKITRTFALLFLAYGFMFALIYSFFNPFFFLLFFGSSLIIVHFINYLTLLLFNDHSLFTLWESKETRKILLGEKLKLAIRFSLLYYIAMIALFLFFYLSGQIHSELIDIFPSTGEIVMIVCYLPSVFVASFIVTKYIIISYVYFNSYNEKFGLVGMEFSRLVKAAVLLAIWWFIQFALQNYYVAIYQSKAVGSKIGIMAIVLITAFLPIMTYWLPQNSDKRDYIEERLKIRLGI